MKKKEYFEMNINQWKTVIYEFFCFPTHSSTPKFLSLLFLR